MRKTHEESNHKVHKK